MLTHFIIWFQKIMSIINSPWSHQIRLQYWKAVRVMVADTSFSKLQLTFKSWNFTIGNVTVSRFLRTDRLTLGIFEKISAKNPRLNSCSLSLALSGENSTPGNKPIVHLAPQMMEWVLFLEKAIVRRYAAGVLFVHHCHTKYEKDGYSRFQS